MIFLSHNYNDKPVVEPVAIRLRDIYGQDEIFYDSWTIQPGDGIIEKMNSGLASPDFVFFFVSKASLASKMVSMEWQNALYKSTKGECKIVPVRVDGSAMPAILAQNVYIDMFAQGIETAIVQIVNVVQGQNTFTPQHLGFSNLTHKHTTSETGDVIIEITASHLMEPNPMFLVLVDNQEGEITVKLTDGSPHRGGFNPDLNIAGHKVNGVAVAPLGGAVVPGLPLRITLKPSGAAPVVFRGVCHQETESRWPVVPPSIAN